MDTPSTEQPASPTEQEIRITLREQVLIVRNEASESVTTTGEATDAGTQTGA